ncbi:MAG: thiopurine S-methyltransferase [Myxococcota bacterium]
MKAEFWKDRWEQNQLGWHQSEANPRLVREWPSLGVPGDATVFVPLCGKSLDMRWLREQGHPILGCELSSIACRDFFVEGAVEVAPMRDGAFERFEAEGFRLLNGDLFDLTAQDLEGVGGVFDRGSLVALPPEMRARYAAHLTKILPATVRILLLTFEYDQSVVDGPPHSVPAEEVVALFGDAFALTRRFLSEPSPPRQPHFIEAGLESTQESVWVLERSPDGPTGRLDR